MTGPPRSPGLRAPAGPQNHLHYELFLTSSLRKHAILFLPARRTRATIGPSDVSPIHRKVGHNLRADVGGSDAGRLCEEAPPHSRGAAATRAINVITRAIRATTRHLW